MKNPLENLHLTLIIGLVLAVVALLLLHPGDIFSGPWLQFLFRWLHVLTAILWIGLLYYFNFVQIPSMPKIPDEHKPAIGKVIAPNALFWFRWAAAATVFFGLITAGANDELDGLYFAEGHRAIGLGMWLALIMAANVWFVIWPNQKRVLGIVEADADSKKRSARTALLASRTNTMLSLPMLLCMAASAHGLPF